MEISIKDFQVEMKLKTKGMELDVYDSNGNHLGDLVIAKGGLVWCKGKVKRENGVKISWTEFIKWAED